MELTNRRFAIFLASGLTLAVVVGLLVWKVSDAGVSLNSQETELAVSRSPPPMRVPKNKRRKSRAPPPTSPPTSTTRGTRTLIWAGPTTLARTPARAA